jgi:hypothetical protein
VDTTQLESFLDPFQVCGSRLLKHDSVHQTGVIAQRSRDHRFASRRSVRYPGRNIDHVAEQIAFCLDDRPVVTTDPDSQRADVKIG